MYVPLKFPALLTCHLACKLSGTGTYVIFTESTSNAILTHDRCLQLKHVAKYQYIAIVFTSLIQYVYSLKCNEYYL